MNKRLLMCIFWPSFLMAGVEEGILFSLVDPDGLHFFGQTLELSRQAIYSLAFFVFWALGALSSLLSVYLLPGGLDTLRDESENSLV